MRDLTTITVNAVAVATQRNLGPQYQAAADFFQAMADAVEAKEEIASHRKDALHIFSDADEAQKDLEYWRGQHQAALGRAAVALQQIPVKWAAILQEG